MATSTSHLDFYKKLASIPSANNAWIKQTAGEDLQVSVVSTTRDVYRNKKFKFSTQYVQHEGGQPKSVGMPTQLGAATLIQPSPSFKYNAVFRAVEKKDSEEKDKYSLEIWDESHMIKTIPTDVKHGSVYTDNWFGSVAWSPDEKYIAYVAEKNPSKGSKFELREDWGEQYVNRAHPTLFLLNIETEQISAVEGIPENLCCGQVQWHPSGKELVFLGWNVENRRFGIVLCYNRPFNIYSVPFCPEASQLKDKSATPPIAKQLTHKHAFNRCPRFSRQGRLIYLAADFYEPHNNVIELCELEGTVERTIVKSVDHPTSDDEFPGLFCNFLPNQCFLDENHVLIESLWHSSNVPLAVNLSTGVIGKLYDNAHCVVLDVQPPVANSTVATAAIEVSTNNSVPAVYIGRIDLKTLDGPAKPHFASFELLPQSQTHASLGRQVKAAIDWSFESVPIQDSKFKSVEAIFIRPAASTLAGEKVPLVLMPHGGPHGTSTPIFNIPIGVLVQQRRAVALINYRGSLGFGKAFAEALGGHVGDRDIEDCVATAKFLQAKYSTLLDDRVFSYGSSHGGFISGHLVTRPDLKICAGVMINPVANMAHHMGISDIREWCLYESGTTECTAEAMATMFSMSPISKVKQVRAPTLMVLSWADRRVPPSQGLEFFYALKQANVPTKCLKYPNTNHALLEQEYEPDWLMNILAWFDKYNGLQILGRWSHKPGGRGSLQTPYAALLLSLRLLPSSSISMQQSPWATTKKIVALWRNYADHAKESGTDVPTKPLFFLKPTTSIITAGKIERPRSVKCLYHEVELAVVIGKPGRDIPVAEAMNHVAGYAVALDMTAKDIQTEAQKAGGPWTEAKGFDTFLPLSDYKSKESVGSVDNLTLWLKVDGVERQRANTKDMVFNVAQLIAGISEVMAFEAGDMILTGTPSGVGEVKPGQVITAGIERVGEVRFEVVERSYPRPPAAKL